MSWTAAPAIGPAVSVPVSRLTPPRQDRLWSPCVRRWRSTVKPKLNHDLRQRRFALMGHINNILTELRPIRRRHGQHFSTIAWSLGQGVNKIWGGACRFGDYDGVCLSLYYLGGSLSSHISVPKDGLRAGSGGTDVGQSAWPASTLRSPKKRASIVFVPVGALILLMPWLSEIPNILDSILLISLLIVCTVGTVRSYSTGARPVGLVFYPFTFAWLCVGPIYQLSHQRFAWGDTALLSETGLITNAVAQTLIAVVAFTVGYEVLGNRKFSTGSKAIRVAAANIEVRPLIVWALIIAGFALAPLAMSANGGLSGMFANRVDRVETLAESGMSLSEVGGLRYALTKQLPIAVSIAAACLSVIQVRKRVQDYGFTRLRSNEVAGLFLSLGLIVLYCNPSANSRYIAVIAFGSIAIYLCQPRTRRGGFVFAVASVFGTLVIYPLLNVFRLGFDGPTALRSGAEAFASMDFDGFQQAANAQIFVDDRGHTLGHYVLSAVLFFLPRSIWEGKAIPASFDVASNRGYSFTNLSLPLHAELFVEFGIIGMVAAMVAFGIFARRTDSSWLAMGSTRLGLAAPLIAVALLGFLRGPLGSLAPIYLTAVGLFLVGLRHVGKGSGGLPTPNIICRQTGGAQSEC